MYVFPLTPDVTQEPEVFHLAPGSEWEHLQRLSNLSPTQVTLLGSAVTPFGMLYWEQMHPLDQPNTCFMRWMCLQRPETRDEWSFIRGRVILFVYAEI